MSEKTQKFRALQGSFDTANKRFVDCVIPQGIGKVDLSKSNLVVKLDVSAVSTTAGNVTLGAAFDTQVRLNTTELFNAASQPGMSPHSPAAYVRHAELRSARLGVIESLRNVDLLRNSLTNFTKTPLDLEREFSRGQNASFKQFRNNNGILDCAGRGRELSQNKTKDLVIPLSSIFEYCNNNAYDSDKNGDLTVHCEMRFDKLDAIASKINNSIFVADPSVAGGAAADRTDDPADGIKGNCSKVRGGTQVLGSDGPDNESYKFMDTTSVPTDVAATPARSGGATYNIGRVFRTGGQYPDLRDCPYFVGQEVFLKLFGGDDVNNTNPTTAGSPFAAVISRIERANAPSANTGLTAGSEAQASDALDITLSYPAGGVPANGHLPNGKQINSIHIELATGGLNAAASNAPTVSLAINDVEVQVTVDPDNKVVSPYNYVTYHAEEDVYNVLTKTFTRNYDIPAMTRNIYILMRPINTTVSISRDANLKEYRLAINNEDVLGRPIRYNSSLHRELINQVMINSGKRIASLDQKAFAGRASLLGGKAGVTGHGSDDGISLEMIMCPVPFSTNVQKLSVELNGFDDANPPTPQDLGGSHVVYFERILSK